MVADARPRSKPLARRRGRSILAAGLAPGRKRREEQRHVAQGFPARVRWRDRCCVARPALAGPRCSRGARPRGRGRARRSRVQGTRSPARRATSRRSPRRSCRAATRRARREAGRRVLHRPRARRASTRLERAGVPRGTRRVPAGFAKQHPDAGQFADLDASAQLAYLKSVETTPFFGADALPDRLRPARAARPTAATSSKLGWKLVGFVDQHAWPPPFGHYDRDYPGFEPYAEGAAVMSARTYKPARRWTSSSWAPAPPAASWRANSRRPGYDVVVMEQGPRFTAADFKHDELDYWFNNALHQQPAVEPADLPQHGRATRPSA